MWYMYTMEYYSAIKTRMVFVPTGRDLEIIISDKVSQNDKHLWYHLIQMNLSTKQTVLQDTKNRLVVAKGKGDEGELDREFGMNRWKLSHTKWINSKALLYSMLFPFSPSICHGVMGPDAMILVFWMLSFKPAFSLSSFTFIKRLFSSSALSAIRVVSSAYLRLLIFLLAILIPTCAPSSPAFRMMYSA